MNKFRKSLFILFSLYILLNAFYSNAASSSLGETTDEICRRITSIHNAFFSKEITATSSKLLHDAFEQFKVTYNTSASYEIKVNLNGLSSRQRIRLMRSIVNHKLSKKPTHTDHTNRFWGHELDASPDEKKHVDLIPIVYQFGNSRLTVTQHYYYTWDASLRKFLSRQPGNCFIEELGTYDEEYEEICNLLGEIQDIENEDSEEEEERILHSPLSSYIANSIKETRKGVPYTERKASQDVRRIIAKPFTYEDISEITETINFYSIVFDIEVARRLQPQDIYHKYLPIGIGLDLILRLPSPWEHLFLEGSPYHIFTGYEKIGHPEARITKFQNLCKISRETFLQDNVLLEKHLIDSFCKDRKGDDSDVEDEVIVVDEISSASTATLSSGQLSRAGAGSSAVLRSLSLSSSAVSSSCSLTSSEGGAPLELESRSRLSGVKRSRETESVSSETIIINDEPAETIEPKDISVKPPMVIKKGKIDSSLI